MRKTRISTIVIVVLIVALAGCGEKETSKSVDVATETTVIEETVVEQVDPVVDNASLEIIDEDVLVEEARGYIFVDQPQKDIEKAKEIIVELAKNGNAEAQYLLGWIYDYEVQENNENKKAALEWYKKSIEQGYLKSYIAACANDFATYDEILEWQNNLRNSDLAEINDVDGLLLLGDYYYTGIDFIPDKEKAIMYYEKSAELGYSRAMNCLGNVLDDEIKAFEWFEKSADKNDPSGIGDLGYCYATGFGVEKDINKGIQLLEKAGELGFATAYSNLGYIYENGYDDIEQDSNKAIEYYQKAAELGYASSYANISIMYQQGIGLDADIEKAMEYAKKGAEDGSGYAAYGVAYYYEKELNDADEAKIWYLKSANLGYEDAILLVASQYLAEQTDESFKKAIELYKLGMRNGSAESFCNLGAMYHMAHGVEKDNAMAAKLLLTAEKLGSENATELMQASEIKEEIEKIEAENN